MSGETRRQFFNVDYRVFRLRLFHADNLEIVALLTL